MTRKPFSGPIIRAPLSEKARDLLVGGSIAVGLFVWLCQTLPVVPVSQ